MASASPRPTPRPSRSAPRTRPATLGLPNLLCAERLPHLSGRSQGGAGVPSPQPLAGRAFWGKRFPTSTRVAPPAKHQTAARPASSRRASGCGSRASGTSSGMREGQGCTRGGAGAAPVQAGGGLGDARTRHFEAEGSGLDRGTARRGGRSARMTTTWSEWTPRTGRSRPAQGPRRTAHHRATRYPGAYRQEPHWQLGQPHAQVGAPRSRPAQ